MMGMLLKMKFMYSMQQIHRWEAAICIESARDQSEFYSHGEI